MLCRQQLLVYRDFVNRLVIDAGKLEIWARVSGAPEVRCPWSDLWLQSWGLVWLDRDMIRTFVANAQLSFHWVGSKPEMIKVCGIAWRLTFHIQMDSSRSQLFCIFVQIVQGIRPVTTLWLSATLLGHTTTHHTSTINETHFASTKTLQFMFHVCIYNEKKSVRGLKRS